MVPWRYRSGNVLRKIEPPSTRHFPDDLEIRGNCIPTGFAPILSARRDDLPGLLALKKLSAVPVPGFRRFANLGRSDGASDDMAVFPPFTPPGIFFIHCGARRGSSNQTTENGSDLLLSLRYNAAKIKSVSAKV